MIIWVTQDLIVDLEEKWWLVKNQDIFPELRLAIV